MQGLGENQKYISSAQNLSNFDRTVHNLQTSETCKHFLPLLTSFLSMHSYKVMQSCWDKEPNRRPGFGELGETLKGLLSELPVLEASLEASYINQGLEAVSSVAASLEPQTDSGRRWENVYLPAPVAAAAARDEYVEEENGYLKSTV